MAKIIGIDLEQVIQRGTMIGGKPSIIQAKGVLQ